VPSLSRRPTSRRLLALLPLVAALAACSVSEKDEVAMGREYAARIYEQVPLVTDPELAGYVQQLGMAIASRTSRARLDWHFVVVDSREVNAFALPGGFIYVNRGLIERTDRLDELAGALGHEIGHVVRRHSAREMEKGNRAHVVVTAVCTVIRRCDDDATRAAIQAGGAALFARYSRTDEAEADSEAVANVVRAGIDPEGIPALFERLLEERRTAPGAIAVFFASHPLEEDRIRASRREIARLDPRMLRGLIRDDEAYHRFRARLKLLPPSPEPTPDR
jgi:predicted Zn-dependent protease